MGGFEKDSLGQFFPIHDLLFPSGHPAVFSFITGRNHPFAVKWPAGLEILLSGHRSFCPPPC